MESTLAFTSAQSVSVSCGMNSAVIVIRGGPGRTLAMDDPKSVIGILSARDSTFRICKFVMGVPSRSCICNDWYAVIHLLAAAAVAPSEGFEPPTPRIEAVCS